MLCWWCCHPWTLKEPLHLPWDYDDKRQTFKTTGNFCSWECMKAFSIDKYGINRGGLYNSYATHMRKKMDGKLTLITTAPSKWNLKIFGGTMDIDEFRKNSRTTAPIFFPWEIHKMPVHCIEESGQKTKGGTILSKGPQDELYMNQIYSSSGKTESLKLKRPKPVNRNQDSIDLESSLGLVRTSQ